MTNMARMARVTHPSALFAKNPVCAFPSGQNSLATASEFAFTFASVSFKVLEGHHPRGTILREALRGNLPLRGLCGGLSEGSAGSLRGFCGVSAGFCGGPRDFPRVFGGSDPMLVTLGNLEGVAGALS